MEDLANPNCMPEMNLGIVDKAKEIGSKLIGLCSYYPPTDYPSEHRGAAAMLDSHLSAARCPDELETNFLGGSYE